MTDPDTEAQPRPRKGSDSRTHLHEHYTVGWVCALPKEQTAAIAMLDERHPDLPKPSTDSNAYTLGSIGKHLIVIACLPKGQIGNTSAAIVATRMVSTFPAVKACFMVGIGGGIPSSKVRLGDVVVGTPVGQYPGVVQWDIGKAQEGGRFERTGALDNPPAFLLTALAKLESTHEMQGSKIDDILEDLRQNWPRLASKYLRSASLEDVLFKADYKHVERAKTDETDEDEDEEDDCQLCDRTQTKKRKPREIRVHYGLIASGNQVIKDAIFRDKLNKTMNSQVLCVEMEAAGLVASFPCLVVRGICDYADSHKNKKWQEHAAAVAAAFTKELLSYVQPQDINEGRPVREILEDLRDAVSATKSDVEQLRQHARREEDHAVLEWLTPFDYGPQQSDLLSRCHSGTGQWFIQSDQFRNWVDSIQPTTLFCTGIPGAGKTIMTSLVIDHLYSRFRGKPDVGIAYVFCNFRRHDDQQYADILASLLKQLCRSLAAVPSDLKRLHGRHRPHSTRPSLAELKEILRLVTRTYSRTYLLIDALDECQSLDGTRSAVVAHLFGIQNEATANLFYTSRHVPDVERHFEKCEKMEIRAKHQDIQSYVSSHLSQILRNIPPSPNLHTQTQERILRVSDGMFLLAHLCLESLRDKTSVTELRTTMDSIDRKQSTPHEKYQRQHALYQAYDEAMTRIANQSAGLRDLGMRTLTWIVHAEKPLSPQQLQHALAIKEGDTEFDHNNLRTIEVTLSACAGLVIVDPESNTIRLIHFTAQEYFEVDDTRTKYFPNAHLDISTACAAYLCLDDIEDLGGGHSSVKLFLRTKKRLCLFSYAAKRWGNHVRKSSKVSPTVFQFLAKAENVMASGRLLPFPPRTPHTDEPGHTKMWTALHLAAFFNLPDLIETLVQNQQNSGSDDECISTPLLIASCKGYETVTRLLLEGGAQVDDGKDYWSRTPLHIASIFGHEHVARLLLEAGASVDACDRFRVTTLHASCRAGHSSVCKLLIQHGADIEARDLSGQTPLHFASVWGHEAVCKLLLDCGADIEARDYSGLTPSLEGGYRGRHRLYVTRHEDPVGSRSRSRKLNGWTPLWVALSRRSNMAAVELLINEGAEFDLVDGLGQTPLMHAIHLGNDDGVRTLLAMGASIDMNERDSNGRSPLYFVASINGISCRKILYVEFKESEGWTYDSYANIARMLTALTPQSHHRGPVCALRRYPPLPI